MFPINIHDDKYKDKNIGNNYHKYYKENYDKIYEELNEKIKKMDEKSNKLYADQEK